MTSAALVVMAKQPQPGRTKTRLCPPFTHPEAAWFYEALLKDTLVLAQKMEGVQLAIAITPPESYAYFEEIMPPGTLLLPVDGADIGVCLVRAMSPLLELGYGKVLALNADGPSLPAGYLLQAVQALDTHDLVLGPGEDGGYYLVGLKSMHREIFQEIEWSTPHVLQQTLTHAAHLGLSTALTPLWYDIDLPADVERLRQELAALPSERLPHTRKFFPQKFQEAAAE
jgi:uncharacterized protein